MVKFLILRFSSIGDIVLTTPVIRHLKEQVDEVQIHYLTKKSYASLLESNPYVDKVLSFDGDMLSCLQRRAKMKREELAAVGAGAADPVAPTGDGRIDRAWRSAVQTAESLEAGDYFQKAINTIQNFWDENQNLAAPGSGWDERVNNQVRAI